MRSVTKLCLTLWDAMGYSWLGPTVHGILQARILEWLLCPPPGDLPDSEIEPVSPESPALAGVFFITEQSGKLPCLSYHCVK